MYSQNNEDDILTQFFANTPNGSFLEIGAFHPKNLSNTRALGKPDKIVPVMWGVCTDYPIEWRN